MLSLENETTQDADEHTTVQQFVLKVFRMAERNVVELVKDNCKANRFISTKLEIALPGSASNRSQLSVEKSAGKKK